MSDDITGRGFWDVIDNHMFEIGLVVIIGIWNVRAMWSDSCAARMAENIATVKIHKLHNSYNNSPPADNSLPMNDSPREE